MSSRADRSSPTYRLLNRPWLYAVAQAVLAPGQHARITQALDTIAKRLPPPRRVLDLGCGPASWLWNIGLRPVGLDIAETYVAQYQKRGDPAVVGNCATLPFKDNTFDQAWSVGLLHHLSDQMAQGTVAEMKRVLAPRGAAVIVDAVLPRYPWRRPIAYALRKLDRGGHVRTEEQHRKLFDSDWQVSRHLMAYNGLEFTLSVYKDEWAGVQ